MLWRVLFMASVVVTTTLAAAGEEDKRYYMRGFLEGGLHPPHNEIEMNLRRPDLPETNGMGDNFGRYAIRGEVFAGFRLGNRVAKSVFVVVKPYFVFGRTIPQIEYTWSARWIGYAKHYGIGLELPKGWSIYIETHSWAIRDQRATTGDGPFGLNRGLYVRKQFSYAF